MNAKPTTLSWMAGLAALVVAEAATGAGLTPEAAARVRAVSGHVAVLPAPGFGDLTTSSAGRTLVGAGLAPHLFLLSPAQAADTNFFHARRFPVAVYLGYESYYQTVRQAGDAETALRCYLAGGGTLLVLASGPFPLYYNEKAKPAHGAAKLGLNIGAGSFEQPPRGVSLTFRANPNQTILPWPEPAWPFPAVHEADQRWRPSRPPAGEEAHYTPLATLWDSQGANHGDGAALLEFTRGPLRGGRVVHVWCSLLALEERRAFILDQLLRYTLNEAPALPGWLSDSFEGRTGVTEAGVIWDLQAGQWRLDQGNLVGEDCVADAYEIKGAARGHLEWRDYSLFVRFRIERRGSDWRDGPWFGLRCRPDGDGYYLTFTDRDCQLHKVLYGVSTRETTALARAAWSPDTAWHTLQWTARGHRLAATLDGRELFDLKDNAHLNLPSLRRGGIVLAARKSSRSAGHTVVRFDDVDVRLEEAP